MLIIGIDPGDEGGIAVMDVPCDARRSLSQSVVAVRSLPKITHFTGKGKQDDIRSLSQFILATQGSPARGRGERVLFCIETISHRPLTAEDKAGRAPKGDGAGDGAEWSSGGGMLKLSFGVGLLHGMAIMNGWQVHSVHPASWHAALKTREYVGENTKERALAYVKEKYPGIDLLATPRSKKPHKGIVDAICIADYAVQAVSNGKVAVDEVADICGVEVEAAASGHGAAGPGTVELQGRPKDPRVQGKGRGGKKAKA